MAVRNLSSFSVAHFDTRMNALWSVVTWLTFHSLSLLHFIALFRSHLSLPGSQIETTPPAGWCLCPRPKQAGRQPQGATIFKSTWAAGYQPLLSATRRCSPSSYSSLIFTWLAVLPLFSIPFSLVLIGKMERFPRL